MSVRGTYRRHSPPFKHTLCQEIRSSTLTRRETRVKYEWSANLILHGLSLYDRGELISEEVQTARLTAYEAKIAALERKVGQLTMELELLKKRHRSGSPAAAAHPP